MLIFEGLHLTDKANAGAAKLAAIGYRHPNYGVAGERSEGRRLMSIKPR